MTNPKGVEPARVFNPFGVVVAPVLNHRILSGAIHIKALRV
ncbi:MAG TPA: hypothetical protein VF181_12410 [Balneolaceae bacterium]